MIGAQVESIDIKEALVTMVETMLPRFSDPKLGLYFCLDMRFYDLGFAEDGNTQLYDEWSYNKNIEIIIQRPSNYTKVLVRISDKTDPKIPHLNETFTIFKKSDHDSGWRDDGFRDIFKVFVQADKQYDIDRPDRNRLIDWGIFHGFSIFCPPKYVKFKKIKPQQNDNGYSYTYNVEIEKFMDVSEAAEYLIKKD